MLKISSGLLRGVSLRSPVGKQTRPTGERLRQSLFNVLRHYSSEPILEIGPVIDLFAGTGAWGIEAISNGAQQVWLVESHPLALKTLQSNIEIALNSFKAQNLDLPVIKVLPQDVSRAYPKLPDAAVIFCDPPYEHDWFERVLELEDQFHRLRRGGLFLYEAATREVVPPKPGRLRLFDSKIYGDSTVHLFVKEQE